MVYISLGFLHLESCSLKFCNFIARVVLFNWIWLLNLKFFWEYLFWFLCAQQLTVLVIHPHCQLLKLDSRRQYRILEYKCTAAISNLAGYLFWLANQHSDRNTFLWVISTVSVLNFNINIASNIYIYSVFILVSVIFISISFSSPINYNKFQKQSWYYSMTNQCIFCTK